MWTRRHSKYAGWALASVPFIVFVHWYGLMISSNDDSSLLDQFPTQTRIVQISEPSQPDRLNRSLSLTEIRPEEIPENQGIFFFETNTGRPSLTSVDECAFESAARFNPNAKIFVLVDKRNHHITKAPDLINRYGNLNVHKFNVTRLIEGSPLSDYIRDVFWYMGSSMLHMSDFLKALMLYLKGGITSDSDLVCATTYPSFQANEETQVENLCSMDFKSNVNPVFLKFRKGHPFLAMVLEDMKISMRNSDFSSVGSMLFSRLMEDQCKVLNIEAHRRHPDFDIDLSRPLTSNALVNYTFVCPQRWNMKVYSLFDKAIVPFLEWIKELEIPPKGKAEYPNLLALHIQDLPNKLYSTNQQIADSPGTMAIFKEFCPLTAKKILDDLQMHETTP